MFPVLYPHTVKWWAEIGGIVIDAGTWLLVSDFHTYLGKAHRDLEIPITLQCNCFWAGVTSAHSRSFQISMLFTFKILDRHSITGYPPENV